MIQVPLRLGVVVIVVLSFVVFCHGPKMWSQFWWFPQAYFPGIQNIMPLNTVTTNDRRTATSIYRKSHQQKQQPTKIEQAGQ